MEFVNAMKERYTTKMYDPTLKVSKENIEKLKEVLRFSASSINSQPWHFTFVGDPTVKSELAEASFFNKDRINQASHVIVFSAINSAAYFENRMPDYLPEGAIGYYNAHLKDKGNDAVVAWMGHQVYLALGFLLSACAEMNIDSTPMEGIEPEKYQRILGETNFTPLFAVAIGYRDANDKNQPAIHPKSRLNEAEIISEI